MSAETPRVLIPEERLRQRVRELAHQIAQEFIGHAGPGGPGGPAGPGRHAKPGESGAEGAPVVALGVLNGSFVFLADLVRALPEPVECGFILLSSSPRDARRATDPPRGRSDGIDLRLTAPVDGRRVLLVEDILDSGRTLEFVIARLLELGAIEVRTCVLLDKPSRRIAALQADWVGFQVPDVWVVGYGLDHERRFRQLPHLGAIGGPT